MSQSQPQSQPNFSEMDQQELEAQARNIGINPSNFTKQQLIQQLEESYQETHS